MWERTKPCHMIQPAMSDSGPDRSAATLAEDELAVLRMVVRGTAAEVRPYACARLRLGEREEWLLRTPEWAYLLPVAGPPDEVPRQPRLYVKPDDRWEVNDVRQHHLELVDELTKNMPDLQTTCQFPNALGQ